MLEDKPPIETYKLGVLSLYHLHSKDGDLLESGCLCTMANDYSYCVYLSPNNEEYFNECILGIAEEHFSYEFIEIIIWARKQGYGYLFFDIDGEPCDLFEQFDWAS